jgi:hypothetical protein
MNANFLRHPARRDTSAHPAPDDIVGPPAPATGPPGRACCCAAKAVVEVIMPATPDRPRPTDLLLCGHHYRASRHALEAAQATVRELPGTSDDVASWIGPTARRAPDGAGLE